jgi:hypothetical protein
MEEDTAELVKLLEGRAVARKAFVRWFVSL